MSKRGMLIVVSGPSGVGKDTIVDSYRSTHPNTVPSISATTRAPRHEEEDGVHYYFVSQNAFEQMIDHGEMLEHARYNSNYYGTPKAMVEKSLAKGNHVVLVIEVQGAAQIKQLMPESLLIFIAPPSLEELRQRLLHRGTEGDDAIEQRMKTACEELKQAKHYDFIIENQELDTAIQQFATVVAAAERSPKHVPELLKGVCDPC